MRENSPSMALVMKMGRRTASGSPAPSGFAGSDPFSGS